MGLKDFAEVTIVYQAVSLFFPREGCSSVSRFWLRLISVVSLAAYFLANTGASLAVESWMKRFAKQAAASARADLTEQPGSRQDAPKPAKCKSCSVTKVAESEEPAGTHPRSHDCEGPCDEECPCCPKNSGHQCPCNGGCAMCSPAKAPCFTPISVELHDIPCFGACYLVECSSYLSPLTGGLDRPPRA